MSCIKVDSYNGLNDILLRVLGSCIAKNVSLKSLSLGRVPSVTSDAWRSFFSRLHGSMAQFENINLRENLSIDDSVLSEFLCLLNPGSKIKSFDLFGCKISHSGWDSLMNVLDQTSVEQLMAEHLDTCLDLPDNLYRLLANGNLKKIALFLIPIELVAVFWTFYQNHDANWRISIFGAKLTIQRNYRLSWNVPIHSEAMRH